MSFPFLKFYTSDWRSDPRLKMCSAASRGVWVEMICLMHEASPYGHLLIHGQSPNEAQLASLTGIPVAELTECLGELERFGVFSRTKEGVIYSRKLVRMASKSAKSRKNGKLGGNPTLRKQTEKKESLNLEHKGCVKPQKPESRSQIKTHDGDDAGAREPPSPPTPPPAEPPEPPPNPQVETFRERLLAACGVDPVSGLTGIGGSRLGDEPQMIEARRWLSDLRLTEAQVVGEMTRQIERKRDGPPTTLRYFTPGMERLAGQLLAARSNPMQPHTIATNPRGRHDHGFDQQGQPAGGPQDRPDPALENIARIVRLRQASGDGCG